MHTLEQLRSGALAGATRFNLSCGLQEFPPEIFELADTLEILDLSGNALSSLPDDLPRLRKLRVLFCSNNRFTELPAVLGQCAELSMVGFKSNQIRHVPDAALPPGLRWLILTDNQIEALPAAIGRCTRLQKLMLAGNRLRSLPLQLAACTNLELVRIAANQLTELPDWLLALPRLSWLAYAGNPFCVPAESSACAAAADIPWSRLRLLHKLGEGASGLIHLAERLDDEGAQPVAVKLFKGAMTSDGLPMSEMAACIAAGGHANLIPLHGKIAGHPEEAHGLVLHRVEEGYANLAGPPSLASCTRDIYPDDVRFTPDVLLRIALGIASAIAQLHARGLMHGDLYAHNILHDGAGHALLGDFGAASFLPDTAQAITLQRIEVRAFACLLEELLERCDWERGLPGMAHALGELQQQCAQQEVGARPLFAAIVQQLQRIGAQRAANLA